ncbi:MAG TPA: biotin/lipoyl-containing protein, partial [Cellvibrionaceae bacterium]
MNTQDNKRQPQAGAGDKLRGTTVAIETIKVPDIGGAENVDVIEISVAVGDTVALEDSLLVLETDKASMEIPSSAAGKVVAIKVKEGDKVSEGDAIIEIETSAEGSKETSDEKAEPAAEKPAAAEKKTPAAEPAKSSVQDVPVPDIGDASDVDVIEVPVKAGDEVGEGDTLIVLETDKASMEIPSPAAGKIVAISVKEGDKVSAGSVICQLESSEAVPAAEPEPSPKADSSAQQPAPKESAEQKSPAKTETGSPVTAASVSSGNNSVYAGPAVRKLARQLGVDLGKVNGSGPRSRLVKDDIRDYVKNIVSASQSGQGVSGGSGIPPIPAVDFAKFGEIETVKMSKIKKLTADNMVRNWLNIPHVTQWDDADITDLEAFRNGLKAEAEKRGTKLTPLPFLIKAAAAALVAEPSFNVSVHHDGE